MLLLPVGHINLHRLSSFYSPAHSASLPAPLGQRKNDRPAARKMEKIPIQAPVGIRNRVCTKIQKKQNSITGKLQFM
jgi:hypothetical protein